jgi:hypothetical protein
VERIGDILVYLIPALAVGYYAGIAIGFIIAKIYERWRKK